MKKRLCLRGKNVGRAETVKEAHTGMKDVFLVYNKCCFYEIVILNYFMNFSHCDMVFCTLDGKPIRAMEGFTVNADAPLNSLEKGEIRSFVLPGGNIPEIDTAEVHAYLQDLKKKRSPDCGNLRRGGRAGSRGNTARCPIDAFDR